MKLLDLFCGAGGASVGYWRAGFEVVGVDIEPQPRYGFEFHQADALTFPLDGFDAIHASPPCHAYTSLKNLSPMKGKDKPDLIWDTRAYIESAGVPYVIENVVGSPLRGPILLCGSMFELGAEGKDGTWRQLRRHRLFESNVPLTSLTCMHEGTESIGVYGGGASYKKKSGVRGGYQGSSQERRAAMGLNSFTRNELNQAIPPAYTEFIGNQLLAFLNR